MDRKGLFTRAALGGALVAAAGLGVWSLGKAEVAHAITPQGPAAAGPSSFAALIARVEPAVVSVDVERKTEVGPAALTSNSFESPRDGDHGPPFDFDFRQFFGGQRPEEVRRD